MTVIDNTNQDLIGRNEVNDIEAILAITNTDRDATEHLVPHTHDTVFTWDYSLTRPPLRKLYEKAKTSQWNGSTDTTLKKLRHRKIATTQPAGLDYSTQPTPAQSAQRLNTN